MIESLGVTRNCWRKAVRETQSGLQITWHDGNECAGPKEQCRHAVVVGYPRRGVLVNDCSGRRVKPVESLVKCLYTADEAEAEAAYQDAVEYARQCGREGAATNRDEPVVPVCAGMVDAAINEAKEGG